MKLSKARTAEGVGTEAKTDPRIHKAIPTENHPYGKPARCKICGQNVNLVPGGSGPTWVHADSGAVIARDPPDTRPTFTTTEFLRLTHEIDKLRAALQSIASCEMIAEGDVVSIARKALRQP